MMKRFMNRPVSVVTGVVALLLLGSAIAAQAAECLPFSFAAQSGEIVDSRGNRLSVIQTGTATHLGSVIVYREIRQFGDVAVGDVTMEAANGNLLFLLTVTEFNPETGRFEGWYEITGGTGGLEGATGSGTQIQGQGLNGTICF
jgi:hypothetical protein